LFRKGCRQKQQEAGNGPSASSQTGNMTVPRRQNQGTVWIYVCVFYLFNYLFHLGEHIQRKTSSLQSRAASDEAVGKSKRTIHLSFLNTVAAACGVAHVPHPVRPAQACHILHTENVSRLERQARDSTKSGTTQSFGSEISVPHRTKKTCHGMIACIPAHPPTPRFHNNTCGTRCAADVESEIEGRGRQERAQASSRRLHGTYAYG